jgi:hypothetical protein
MRYFLAFLAIIETLAAISFAADVAPSTQSANGKIAAKPLFRDPVFDGAADPTPIWNAGEKKWFIFYTNRRASAPPSETPGFTWMHGTRIGIAESSDNGATWKYRGTADIQYGDQNTTQWAPEVIENAGTYHMYLAIVPGIFPDWEHPRSIIHLTSSDLLHWKFESTLKLASDRDIDPCVLRLPDGTWRMWYNDERDHKSTYYADSPDLFTWTDHGKAFDGPAGEGPQAFRWKGHYWMLVDVWKGLAVYQSDDAKNWIRQKENLLGTPGHGPDDNANGGHPGVVVSGDRAYVFYHVHPGHGDPTPENRRRSSLQVVELQYKDGQLTADRDQPTHIFLLPGSGRQ